MNNSYKHPVKYAVLFLSVLLSACESIPVQLPGSTTVATREFRLSPGNDVIGDLATITTKRGDTLPDIARHYSLGHNDVAGANPNVDVWVPHAGARVLLPLQFVLPDEAPRQGIVLNVATMRIYYYPEDTLDNRVFTYPVGIGREGWATPTGHMRIVEKKEQPDWRVPASIRKEHAQMGDPLPAVVPAGPDNPLGEFAMRLTRPEYLIHGTNKPYGIGMRVSHGCVRLYPEDIQPLFQSTALSTDVHLIDQPYLLGWRGDVLYLEAHPPLQKSNRKLKKLIGQLVRKIE
ncbi:MAG: L,D-transpeptidase family protein, partial [Gammaproteobacteria bacterium]|nr:L,D-transpeptidase family protein [Gammaproteobacteria bacterium]